MKLLLPNSWLDCVIGVMISVMWPPSYIGTVITRGMFHLEHMHQPSTNKGHISLLQWAAGLQSSWKIWEELDLYHGY